MKKFKTTRDWNVYVIVAASNAVKIGITADHPEKRLRELQVGCPVPANVLAFARYEMADLCEQLWHLRLWKYHSVGEWFIVPERLVPRIGKMVASGRIPSGGLDRQIARAYKWQENHLKKMARKIVFTAPPPTAENAMRILTRGIKTVMPYVNKCEMAQ